MIGNGAYENADVLPNAPRDARAMAAALGDLGFEVLVELDLDHGGFRRALANFARQLEGAQAGLFFYAGHGLQVDGRNFLVPIEAELEREADLYLQVVAIDDVLRIMETTVPTRLVFLDACRDNPLARSLARTMGATRSGAVGEGLARMDAAVGTLIAYATAPGHVAFDGRGDNSPFTAALVEHIGAPNLEVRQVLTRVRSSVLAVTGNRQVPWDSSSLTGDFYFNLTLNLNLSGQGEPTLDREGVFWQSIQASDDPADFEAYLLQFPQGTYAALARNRQARLQRMEQPAMPSATAPASPPGALEPPADVPGKPLSADAALGLTRENWLDLQEALTLLGFDTRGNDGNPGPDTRKAIAAWQRSRSKEATGFFTKAERDALLAEAAALLAALDPGRVDRPQAVEDPSLLAPGAVFRDCLNCPEMVIIPSGSFLMGSPESEPAREDTEGPLQEVTIAQPFAIGRYEVSRGEFRTFVEETECAPQSICQTYSPPKIGDLKHSWPAVAGVGWDSPGFAQTDAHSVVCVSWADAQAFVGWLSRRTGQIYRLPSEAEWEYAARARSSGKTYWPDEDNACEYANIYDRSGDEANGFDYRSSALCDDGYPQTAPVGSFLPNRFGLFDTHGNVSEWVADCWSPSLKGMPLDGTARVTDADCQKRVRRGGAWVNNPGGSNARSARRVGASEYLRAPYQGFRVVRELR